MDLADCRQIIWVILLLASISLCGLMFNTLNSSYRDTEEVMTSKKSEQFSEKQILIHDDAQPPQVNIIMMSYNRVFHGIYAAGLEYQLNKHIYDYGCTPNCKHGSNITVSIDRISNKKYIKTMVNSSNYWIHYQTEQCLCGKNVKQNDTYFRLGQLFPNTVDLLLDWSSRYVSLKDKCYPHVQRAASLNFDATIDPIYLDNSINYFKNISKSFTFDQLRDIDVVLFGDMKDPRRIRANFCQNIKDKYPTLEVDCKRKFSSSLNDKLKRSKVCINLHFYPQASLETHRINQCILWKVAIVSERSGDFELDRKYEQEYGVVFVDFIDLETDRNALDKFVQQVKQLVDDKQKRFQATEMAYKNIVKLNKEKNEQICQIAKSITCHYPNHTGSDSKI